MNNSQKLSPKYWVVHDKRTDDVFIETAHKSKDGAWLLFVEGTEECIASIGLSNYLLEFPQPIDEQYVDIDWDAVEEWLENNSNFECILVEVKSV